MWFLDEDWDLSCTTDFVTWYTLWEHPLKYFILKFYIRPRDIPVIQVGEMYGVHIGKGDSYNRKSALICLDFSVGLWHNKTIYTMAPQGTGLLGRRLNKKKDSIVSIGGSGENLTNLGKLPREAKYWQ